MNTLCPGSRYIVSTFLGFEQLSRTIVYWYVLAVADGRFSYGLLSHTDVGSKTRSAFR